MKKMQSKQVMTNRDPRITSVLRVVSELNFGVGCRPSCQLPYPCPPEDPGLFIKEKEAFERLITHSYPNFYKVVCCLEFNNNGRFSRVEVIVPRPRSPARADSVLGK